MPNKPRVKIGLLLECGREGAEWTALPILIEKIRPGTNIERVAMDSKDKLLQSCGKEVQTLLDIGCQRVFVVWDLRPPWPAEKNKKVKPCRRKERLQVISSLKNAGVNTDVVILLCISMEFEAWLIADGLAITAFIDPEDRWTPISDYLDADRNKNPKGTLKKVFERTKYGGYFDRKHAPKIAEKVTSLSRMKKVESFKRFFDKLISL